MKKNEEVRRLIINLMNSWPSKDYFFHKGWILRFDNGVTYRANSILPLDYYGSRRTFNSDLDLAEKAYQMYNLPAIFTMHDFYKPSYLCKELLDKNYREVAFTVALGGRMINITHKDVNENYEYSFQNKRNGDFSYFLSNHSSRSEEQQKIINRITQRIKILNKCFIIVKSQDLIIGTLMGVLDLNGYLYLADIFVDPNYRRQGIAKSMIYKIIYEWANPIRINMVWLQVEIENKHAIDLYENIGLKVLFSYYYLTNS